MKKILSLVLALVLTFSALAVLSSCGKEKSYEIAVVTDVGQLMDKGFNQGTYEGAKAYASLAQEVIKYNSKEAK